MVAPAAENAIVVYDEGNCIDKLTNNIGFVKDGNVDAGSQMADAETGIIQQQVSNNNSLI